MPHFPTHAFFPRTAALVPQGTASPHGRLSMNYVADLLRRHGGVGNAQRIPDNHFDKVCRDD